jgi:acetyl esterase/lipase
MAGLFGNIKLTPPEDIDVRTVRIGKMKALVLSPKEGAANAPGILWIHGGGYFLGMKEMVYMSRALRLVRWYKAVVVSPGYTLAFQKPYPAAVKDCYKALLYMQSHAEELGIDERKLIVGGESSGGGLAAAVCMLARDRKEVKVAYQLPLYPMMSSVDTESSKDNHGRVWNTRLNHLGWKFYLREKAGKKVSPYASPSFQKDYRRLPPCYTFVGDGEPFYAETLAYVENLKKAGVSARVDVYHTDMHAFDMLSPDVAPGPEAIQKFEEEFERILEELELKGKERKAKRTTPKGSWSRETRVGRPAAGKAGEIKRRKKRPSFKRSPVRL